MNFNVCFDCFQCKMWQPGFRFIANKTGFIVLFLKLHKLFTNTRGGCRCALKLCILIHCIQWTMKLMTQTQTPLWLVFQFLLLSDKEKVGQEHIWSVTSLNVSKTLKSPRNALEISVKTQSCNTGVLWRTLSPSSGCVIVLHP